MRLYTEKKRIFIIMATSVVMNFSLFIIAYYFKFPLWLDTTGTIYAAVILGSPAGFVVAIVNNLIQAFGFYGAESLLFYIVSALTAFVTGYMMKNRKRNILRWLLLTVSLFAVCSLASIIVTLITTEGIPADYWGTMIYNTMIKKGGLPVMSTVVSVSIVKFLDIVVSLIIVMLSVFLTPKAIKSNVATVKNDVVEN